MGLLPFDDRDGFIWMDGKMLPWREAKVHFLAHALHYATQVFEGERAYNGKIFKSVEHSERLIRSAEIINMEVPYSIDELEAAKHEILKLNNLENAYIRAAAWRGSQQMGIDAWGSKVHVAIAAWEWASYFDPALREKGISLKTSHWKKPAPDTAPTASKCACLYNVSTLAKHEAKEAGYHDALMLDHEGYVAESTGANLFAVQNNTLATPIADRFLNGITRQTVLSLAKDMGIEVQERRIKPEDLSDFQEIFLTGTAAEITPVGKIDNIAYTPGEITHKLIAAYEHLTRNGA